MNSLDPTKALRDPTQQLSREQNSIVIQLTFYSLFISCILCMLVVVIVLLCRMLKLPSSQRLSFKLSLWVALVDILYTVGTCLPIILQLINKNWAVSLMSNNPWIEVISIQSQFFGPIWYMVLISLIVLNLHFTFILKKPYNHYFTEFNMVVFSIIPPSLIIIPLAIVAYQFERTSIIDFYKPTNWKRFFLLWVQIDLWLFICVVYNTIIVIKILMIFNNYSKTIKSKDPSIQVCFQANNNDFNHSITHTSSITINSNNIKNLNTNKESTIEFNQTPVQRTVTNYNLDKKLHRIALRVAFYAIIPIITQTLFIIINNYYQWTFKRNDLALRIIFDAPNYLNGALNSLIFLFDPALYECVEQFKAKFITKFTVTSPHISELHL